MVFTKWRIRVASAATLFIGSVAASCNQPTKPSVPSLLSPSSWNVEPLQLLLAVGDTGQVRVVLLKGNDTLGVDATMDGAVRVAYESNQPYPGIRIVNRTQTAKINIYSIEALAPGTEGLGFYYGKWGPCQDPPECLLREWVNLLPERHVVIAVP